MEQIAQNGTIFRDRYLIPLYMRILIKNRVLDNLQGKQMDERLVKKEIQTAYDRLNNKFRLCSKWEEAQLIAQIYKDVTNPFNLKDNVFKMLYVNVKSKQKRDEELLDYNIERIVERLNPEAMEAILATNDWFYKSGPYCQYCASRDVCLENKN